MLLHGIAKTFKGGSIVKLRLGATKLCAVLLAGLTMGHCLPAIPTAAADHLRLRISNVEVDSTLLDTNRVVTVDVDIDGNDQGFIAAEFGIAFDSRLKLQSIRTEGDTGNAFSFSSTEENHMIWFSGANAETGDSSSSGKTRMLSLDFVLPESCAVGDAYYIGYEWIGVDGAEAFWYVDRGEDALNSLMTYSVTGTISIPSPDAPRLNRSELTMNQGESFTLTAMNVSDDGVWFTDDDNIVSVKDGIITALSPGMCHVSVFYASVNALLTCEVNVRSNYVYSMFDEAPVIIDSPDQEVVLEYPNAVGMTQWVSTNSNIVMVEDGVLLPVANGTAQIIASNNGVSKLKTVTVQFEEETTAPPAVIHGDINNDGQVDILDVILMNKYLLGSADLDAMQRTAADVLHDNTLDSSDSLTLLKFVVKLISVLPVEI